MQKYWFISGDFLGDRSRRIGASDIPALIPNPEKPTESLAAYGRTPVTTWQEKTGRKEREPAGLPAEMGHFLEAKALELFVRNFVSYEYGLAVLHDLRAYDYANRSGDMRVIGGASAAQFQNTAFRHHVQFHRDGLIAHPDLVYDPETAYIPVKGNKVTSYGVTVNFDKPFLVEAKSANYWATKRPEGSIVTGYDTKLKTWQGIPLKHYMQIQFQLALIEVDVCYLALLHNTSQFDVWEIRANPKHQGRLIDLAGLMVKCIETDTAPQSLAMNAEDIMALYPDVGDDFATLVGPEAEAAVELAREYATAVRQLKMWKEKEKDAKDAMAIMLKDRPEIRDGNGIIAKWQSTRGSEKITALSKIKNETPLAYKYLKRKDLLYTSKDSRRVTIPWKGEGD